MNTTPSECQQFEMRMNAWIDDPSQIDLERDEHLLGCSHCRETLRIWHGIERGVHGRVTASKVGRRWKSLAWVASAAAILLAVLGMRALSDFDSPATVEVIAPLPGPTMIAGDSSNQVSGEFVDPLLFGQFLDRSRPAMTQMGHGIEPLGRTLRRTAGLFY